MLSADARTRWSGAKQDIETLARGISGAGRSEEISLDIEPEKGDFKPVTTSALSEFEVYTLTAEEMLQEYGGGEEDEEEDQYHAILPSDPGFQDESNPSDPSLESWTGQPRDEEMEVDNDWNVYKGSLMGDRTEKEKTMIYREMTAMLGLLGGFLTVPKEGDHYLVAMPSSNRVERLSDEALRNKKIERAQAEKEREKQQSSQGLPCVPAFSVEQPKQPLVAVPRPPGLVKAPKLADPKPKKAVEKCNYTSLEGTIGRKVWDSGVNGMDASGKIANFSPLKMGWNIKDWDTRVSELGEVTTPQQLFLLMVQKSQKRNIYKRKYIRFSIVE
ncbi:phosphoprotein [Perhabdovirus trutta]|uniref:Phosphoprotein n=1 Tax=Perhabdovirus trutta TaxID=179986 RepID=A0A6M3H6S4_9RHAB|nr:phosphoprotein [Perhabdovirus trutta]